MTEQAQKVRFTPGPWVAECVGTSSAGPDGVDVYEVNNGHTRIAEHMTEVDARLIAAAPELYEALRHFTEAAFHQAIDAECWNIARAALSKVQP